jgi:hypothetical protein
VVTAEFTPILVRVAEMSPLFKFGLPIDSPTAAAWEEEDAADAIPVAPIALSATSTLTETLFLEVEKRMIGRSLACL